MMQGSDLVNSLVGVLLRFRMDRVTTVADIEAMFHQVKVKPEDCESLSSCGGLTGIPAQVQRFINLLFIFSGAHNHIAAQHFV